jgi:hypothetical protein
MKKAEALTISIGVLGAVDTYLTATVLPVQVWVTFIAWASFFILGGKRAGFTRSVACNLAGVVIAAVTLAVTAAAGAGPLFTAVCVGLGSAAMVQASKAGFLTVTPAIVWGFASTVGTVVATGGSVLDLSAANPALNAAGAMVLGAAFGFASEAWADAMTREPAHAAVAPTVDGGLADGLAAERATR